MAAEARVDKWLWAARIFKTRSIATDACKSGRVTIGGNRLKPAHMVKAGDVVEVKKPPITYSFRIKQAIEHRVGAKLVPEVLENITPKEQYDILELSRIGGFAQRAKGLGRPTKKDRRQMEEFTEPLYFDSDDDDFDFDIDELKPLR